MTAAPSVGQRLKPSRFGCHVVLIEASEILPKHVDALIYIRLSVLSPGNGLPGCQAVHPQRPGHPEHPGGDRDEGENRRFWPDQSAATG